MSLVNDALKRATEAHNRRAAAPVADLPLRPVEPAPPKAGTGLVLPATFLTIILAALVSLLLSKHTDRNNHPTTTTKSELLGITAAAKSPPPVAPTSVAPLEHVPVMAPPAVVTPLVSTPPPPAPLRLQAIFYTPPQPSAIISGQTVRVGDTVRELQVVAIGSASALLMGASQTNFLTLE